MLRLILLALLACTAPAQIFNGYSRFNLNIPPGITEPVSGDFNGDRIPDILVYYATDIKVYAGTGEGTFALPIQTPLPAAESRKSPHNAAVGDFNLDKKLDLYAFGQIFHGNGDGTFAFATNVVVQDRPQVIDFDRDGIPDLAGMIRSNSFGVVLGSADGRFSTLYGEPIIESSPIKAGSVADLNADGRLDVLLDEGATGLVALLQGPTLKVPPPQFPFTRVVTSTASTGSMFGLADMTGDRISDLVTNSGSYGPLYLYRGRGDGSFEPLKQLGPTSGYFDSFLKFLLADLDGDAVLDVVSIIHLDDSGVQRIYSSYGNGAGTAYAPVPLDCCSELQSDPIITTGDWNSDGHVDLLTSDGKSLVLLLRIPLAVSSATGKTSTALGSLVTLYRQGLTTQTAAATSLNVLPTALGDVQIRVESGRSSYEAELLYVSPTQINFRLRPGLLGGLFNLTALTPNGTLTAGQVSVRDYAPGFFAGAGTITPLSGDASFLLTLYGTGFADADPGLATIIVNNQTLRPEFVGPSPDILGLDIVRVVVPRSAFPCANTGCAQVDLTAKVAVTVNSQKSNDVTISGGIR